MPSLAQLRGRSRAIAGGAALLLSGGGLAAVSTLYDGIPIDEVELHDAGIWVTNLAYGYVGRVNEASKVIDAVLGQTGADFDVLQDDGLVLAVNHGAGTLARIDTAAVAPAAQVGVPLDAQVALGGGTVAVLEASSGSLWSFPATSLGEMDFAVAEPDAVLGAGASVEVTEAGDVYAASASAGAVRLVTASDAAESTESLGYGELGDDLEMTSVGNEPVLLDRGAGELILPGGSRVALDDPEGTQLQAPGPAAASVVYADRTGLVSQPLDGGESTRVEVSDGLASTPVVLGECAYGAWSGSNSFVRDCLDDAGDTDVLAIPNAPAAASYVFRVNRDLVRLNDVAGGGTWSADETLVQVDNWDEFRDQSQDDQLETPEQTEQEEPLLTDRDSDNTPPVASDDDFGARAGRTTILPIVDNDYDLDGDVLSASIVDDAGFPAQIQVIRNGGAVQVAVPEGVTGVSTFRYRVDDGRGGVDEAVVEVTFYGDDVNTAPHSRRDSAFSVEVDGTFRYNVLPDWIDDEGDTLYLVDASTSDGDTISFTADGEIVYRASSGVAGIKQVQIEVSDGRDTATGTVTVTVASTETALAPVTNPDYASTEVGLPVVVQPLANDYSPNGTPLRLASLNDTEAPGAIVEANYNAGSFTFTAERPGTYYVIYAAVLDDRVADGIVRIDVTAGVDVSQPPIAVQDTALVPPGESALVDVLANDTDPGGGVLVVQSVSVPDGAGISVAVLEHRALRITNVSGITAPVVVEYRVSNGAYTSVGDVVVLPIEASAEARAPQAEDDQAVVRAGDVVSVHVLDNDSHPDGVAFSLDPTSPLPNLSEETDAALGEAFVSDDTVRFAANPGVTGTITLTYQVRDANGQRDAARVTIKVIAEDAANSAPRPEAVTARTIAGTTVRIPIPLDGIDPEGDSVSLVGIDTAPTQGRVVQVGQDWVMYEAYPDALGGDAFTYTVRDAYGAEGIATVQVGIAPQEAANQPPVPVADDVTMRPGTTLSVPVLANDSDPEGQTLALVSDGLVVSEGIEAHVSGERVVIEAGSAEGTATVQYLARDTLGSVAFGVVRVSIDTEAPLIAPIARDDRASLADITDEGTVLVDVLANDEDPDGVAAALTVSVDPAIATVGEAGAVAVTPGEDAQLVRYQVTDADGLTASAFIIVPGAGDGRPTLVPGAAIEVTSGETINVALGDLVQTTSGNPAILTEVEKVRASHADGSGLVLDEVTLTYTSAAGYVGPDALTFEVTDGASVDDAEGRVARLTVPVTVLPGDNVAPTLVGASMQVGAGEGPVGLGLAPLAKDANPGDAEVLEFSLAGDVPSELSASIADGVLSVEAGPNVPKGTVLEVPIQVTDGKSEPVAAIVTVKVTASSRPLPAAVDDVREDATAGQPVVVSPLENDYNPFPETPLTLLTVDVESGAATAAFSGDEVTITPAANTYGTVVVRYTMVDATGDGDRTVEGRIRVTVADRPDAPARPVVTAVESGQVTIEWGAPDSRGAEITGYIVVTSDGREIPVNANSYTVTGLTNGQDYTFTVKAVNRKGTSEPSPASETARPDIVPNQPSAPTLTFGDGSVDVAWTPPANDGTPISSYTLQISPGRSSGATVTGLTGTSTTIDGLENGVAYQVRVTAINEAGESEYSEYSLAEIPAGAPFAPASKPTTTMLSPVGDRAQMQVAWVAADGNGDPVSTYDVYVYRGGTLVNTLTVPGTQTSATVELDTSETNYTFSVRGYNKAPEPGVESVQSDSRRAVIAPAAPTGVTATTPSADRKITVAYTPGARNGAKTSEVAYQYQLNGTGSWAALPSNGVIGPYTAGSSYTVKVRAVAVVEGVTYTGAASSASNAAVPFSPVGQASISATSQSGSVKFTVTAPSGNGRDITKIEYCTNTGTGSCSNFSNANFTSGSKSFTVNTSSPGGSAAITVKVTTNGEAGNTSTVTKSGTSKPITLTASKGAQVNVTGCESTACAYVVMQWSEMPTGNHTVKCWGDYGGNSTFHTFTYNFSSSGTYQTPCIWGWPNNSVWIEVVGIKTSPHYAWSW